MNLIDRVVGWVSPQLGLGHCLRQVSRQAFINDDIGLVTSIPARHAAAARRTVQTTAYTPAGYTAAPALAADTHVLVKLAE